MRKIAQSLSWDDAVLDATSLVEAYTRGRHRLANGDLRPGVDVVIASVARRMMANPTGVKSRESVGPFSRFTEAGFQGFSLPEQVVLNRYRKQAL